MSNQAASDSQSLGRLERLQGFAQVDPGNVPLLRDIAIEAMRARAYEHVLPAVEQLRALGAVDGGDEAAAIHALTKLGRPAEAGALADDARARWADDEGVRLEGARAWLNLSQFDKAIAWAQGPFEEDAIAQMASEINVLAHWHGERPEEALAAGQAAMQRWPGNPRLLSCMSAVLYDLDQTAKAFELAQQAQDISPAHAYESLHVLASQSLLQRDVSAAQRWVDQAQSVRTDDGRIWLLKGSIGLVTGEHEAAVRDLKQALSIYPDHPGSHLTLAWLYITQNRLDEAEQTIQEAIAASPAFAESHGSLGVVHALRGDGELARQSIRRATLLDREGFAARYAQTVLDGGHATDIHTLLQEIIQRVGLGG